MTGKRPQKVPTSAIEEAPSEPLGDETSFTGRDPLTGGDGRIRLELGWVGRFIGGGVEKSGNIALVVVAFGTVLIFFELFLVNSIANAQARASLNAFITPTFGLVSGALGFVFGGSGKGGAK